jgi:hypothetical protein
LETAKKTGNDDEWGLTMAEYTRLGSRQAIRSEQNSLADKEVASSPKNFEEAATALGRTRGRIQISPPKNFLWESKMDH